MQKIRKPQKNNSINLKRKRNKIIIDTNHAEVINIEVAAINAEGGLETTRFVKERSSESIPRIATARDRRFAQTNKAKSGGYRYKEFDATEQKFKKGK